MAKSLTAVRLDAAPLSNGPERVALVAEDGPRQRISQTLERERLAFEEFDGTQALASSRTGYDPTLVILWIEDTVSGVAGYIEPLIQHWPQAPLVVSCPSIERWGVRAALTAGAAGVVLLESIEATLGPCVAAVRTGQICVPREHWRQVEPPALSSREKQILGLVVMGYSNQEIAQQLFLAESTVKSHLSSVFGKLGVRSRNEAVNRILDPDRGLGMGILALVGDSS
jgi:DNA-binding NarL/FixJ family response regulator